MCLGNKPGVSSACKMRVSAIGSLKTLWMPKLSDSTVTFVCPLTVLPCGNTVMLPFSAVPPVSLQALNLPSPISSSQGVLASGLVGLQTGPLPPGHCLSPSPRHSQRPGPPWQVRGCGGWHVCPQVVVSAHILLFLHFSQLMGNSHAL